VTDTDTQGNNWHLPLLPESVIRDAFSNAEQLSQATVGNGPISSDYWGNTPELSEAVDQTLTKYAEVLGIDYSAHAPLLMQMLVLLWVQSETLAELTSEDDGSERAVTNNHMAFAFMQVADRITRETQTASVEWHMQDQASE